MPNTKVVLALGGGGVRMFAHAVVFEFLEKIGVSQYLSEVWGASGGALMAFAYSLGLTPKEMKEIG
ncbi:MAG: patatin-like phospholipase family protein, partial [Deltaproteobacteria bacterium]|nr:patatin-like phospholipase family protein [Deltaproteobacteria bacterium]